MYVKREDFVNMVQRESKNALQELTILISKRRLKQIVLHAYQDTIVLVQISLT